MMKAYSVQLKGYARKRQYNPWEPHLSVLTSVFSFKSRRKAHQFARKLMKSNHHMNLFHPVGYKVYSYSVSDEFFDL